MGDKVQQVQHLSISEVHKTLQAPQFSLCLSYAAKACRGKETFVLEHPVAP